MPTIAETYKKVQTVNFHGHELLLVDHAGQPYTPMRPIVEGMGLAWQTQHRKLTDNEARWGVTKMVIPSDGGMQEAVCMPVRKLPAYLSSIHPNKVKPELRERIRLYQDECDDALWDYWTKGVAINPRLPLAPDQQRAIQELVAQRVQELPEASRRRGYAQLYGAIKTEFRVGTYKDLPQEKFNEACRFVKSTPLEGEWISGKVPALQEEPMVIDLNWETAKCPVKMYGDDFLSLDLVQEGYKDGNPLNRLFRQLNEAAKTGRTVKVADVEGAQIIWLYVKELAWSYKQGLDSVSRSAENFGRRGIRMRRMHRPEGALG